MDRPVDIMGWCNERIASHADRFVVNKLFCISKGGNF
jgi:hypothetical protein